MKKRLLSLLLASVMIALTPFTSAIAADSSVRKTENVKASSTLWKTSSTRDKIVVISDIHLGIDDRYTETLKNKPILIEFLRKVQSTSDIRELVIAGDFLDEWFLPVDYPSYTDQNAFYRAIIKTNQSIIDEFNKVMDKGVKVVYVRGNHDMTLEDEILKEAMPKIVFTDDAKGLGVYYTGDRKEIAIEHGHRYDVFSAPDTVSNAELCGNDKTILPAGYFYARYAATWVLQGRPKVEKKLPVVTKVPDKTNTDQYGAYIYYALLKDISSRMTPKEDLNAKIFDMHISGFNDAYTYLDFYPAQQKDGTISAPVLFKNIQRTWDERQKINKVKIPNAFIEAVSGAINWEYYFKQAKVQYLENPKEKIDVVVFGHTHVPDYRDLGNGKYFLNDGTWIDHNVDYPQATRTFAVITTGKKDKAAIYKFDENGSVINKGTHFDKATK